ncbi:pyridoxal phosphate biosynthesis protein PdxJ-like protein [Leptospira interrogans serovar Bataviae str. HAI135]|nr:pyridoxal phosphate biosynthesis protein PdxJ-like protein [Leptospira interrogans serovar Bataviae str. HAI135]
MGINAGHDLDHENLKIFSKLPGLQEVSIGHRLISRALETGIDQSVKDYLQALL